MGAKYKLGNMISYKNLILVQRDNENMKEFLKGRGMWFNDEAKPF